MATIKKTNRPHPNQRTPISPERCRVGWLFALLIVGIIVDGTFGKLCAQSVFQTIKTFNGPNGKWPRSALTQGHDGMLYGTTSNGGSNDCGTVFKINPDGTGHTILRSFSGEDGKEPYCTLLQTRDGILFGTTRLGGVEGGGTVFRMNPDGTQFAIVKEFPGSAFDAFDGKSPQAGLMQANDGNLYGTTYYGGFLGGVIFRMDANGSNYTALKRLSDKNRYDAAGCWATLIQGLDGALYGTSAQGGSDLMGTVFRITLNGEYATLHSFTGTPTGDGSGPTGSLLQTSDGTLYGVTGFGGIDYQGTIFKISPDGSGYEILKRFTGARQWISSGLLRKADGLFYGLARDGVGGGGSLFQFNPDGSGYAVLHTFPEGDGKGLLLAGDGRLFGTATVGGPAGAGYLFSIEPGAAIFPPTVSAQGVRVRLSGVAGRSYTLQRAPSINGPWTIVSSMTADPTGAITYDDSSALAESRFYRVSSSP